METMNVKDFYFDLPQELIAQDPLEDRSSSRLLVLDKETGEYSHHVFREITEFLKPGDCLVLNNTKVKATGAINRAKNVLNNDRGDFYISDGVKIIIAVVLGALLLGALTGIFNNTVIPRITQEITELFG